MLAILSFLLVAMGLVLRPTAAYPLPKRQLILPIPHSDPFYQAPDNLENLKNGDIYRNRQVYPEIEYAAAESVYQVAYRTTDLHGNASYTVATVFKPWHPDSDAKLFSYQIWEDADNIDCSPSYSVYAGILAPDGATATLDTPIMIDWALSKGYYVVLADHEGPKSTFFAGFNEGYAGIDGIRAAESYLGLSSSTPVALYGYSGGAHATAWMSDLVGTYAPELNIVGAASGGTPVDCKATMEYLDGKTFSGFVLGALTGLLTAYEGEVSTLTSAATSQLTEGMKSMHSDGTCILPEVLDYSNTEFLKMFSLPDFTTAPEAVRMFENESLLKNYSSHSVSTPTFPRYIFHAVGDEIIPFTVIKEYVSQQCAGGADIQFVQWPGGDHVTTEFAGIPNALQFLQQAFEGTTPKVPCGSASQDILTLTTDGVGSIIGQGIVDAINALAGLVTPFGTIVL